MTARFQQTGLISVADRVVRVGTGRGLEAAVGGSATSPAAASLTFTVASGQRELRLDLFRGLALWLVLRVLRSVDPRPSSGSRRRRVVHVQGLRDLQ
jgi:hypothetical protein